MANFNLYYKARLAPFEGGYNFIKEDKGGETYKGVARKANPNWAGWAIVDAWKKNKGGELPYNFIIPDATLDGLVVGLYKSLYWDKLKADYIKSQEIAEILVDFLVNGGYNTKKLQSFLKIKVDGVFGPNMLKSINEANQKGLFDFVWNWRKEHYEKIVKEDPTQEIFAKGWSKRLQSFFFSE